MNGGTSCCSSKSCSGANSISASATSQSKSKSVASRSSAVGNHVAAVSKPSLGKISAISALSTPGKSADDLPRQQASAGSEDSCASSDCCSGNSNYKEPDLDAAELKKAGAKFWYVAGMDCPACASAVENALARITGIEKAAISFSTQKLQVVFADGFNGNPVVESTVSGLGFTLSKTRISADQQPKVSWLVQYQQLIVLAALIVLGLVLGAVLPTENAIYSKAMLVLATLWGLIPVAKQAIELAKTGSPFSIETLMTIAALGALILGETLEAGMVLLLFLVGEHLEGLAASKARQGVESLMALSPDQAWRIRTTENGEEKTQVLASDLLPGDIIEVLPGDRLAADGQLLSLAASFDESALTGESVPVDRVAGENVLAGSLAADQVARLKVTSEPGHNAIDRILKLIEEAEESKAPIERFIDKFSRWYTPSIMLFSALVIVIPPIFFAAEWSVWIYRGLTMLLIGCPCALVISTPAAVTSGLARAAKQGILIKGGAALEQLGSVKQVAFDKTGTLTQGKPQVVDLVAFNGNEQRLLELAAAVESVSRHPLAQAVVAYAKLQQIDIPLAENVAAQAGKGVSGQVEAQSILIGSPVHLAQKINQYDQFAANRLNVAGAKVVTSASEKIAELEAHGKTVIAVVNQSAADDQQLLGVIAISDTLRPDAIKAMELLKRMNISSVMLTGDNPRAAAAIAGTLGIDFRAGLLPEDKVAQVQLLQAASPVAMVGDGINDAPALKSAHVGIAMGQGTDVALETADAALTNDRVTDLASMIDLSRATLQIIRQNVIFAIGLKVVFLATSLFGVTGLMLAVIADTGATALVTLNSLRLLRRKRLE
ncbi:heavy metal translocating P-type ATPase [Pelagibaculum spongiae]|uniref:P-type Zn(2+) transporter n=1 Tax=Pelagibaculum spongiae TaxID=2080658 RepID=A0A2V1GNJ0_9GAMM|nr:heavy metal translocating P-type ATPase [Pelagibaculum spongiae]PVZ63413.1 cadmium-translocating P-type ATPase [Pelagibaculum spongiae]